MLGGLLLGGKRDRSQGVWASVRSAFLLRRRPDAREVIIEVKVPSLVELLPLEIVMSLNGHEVLSRSFDATMAGKIQVLRAPLPPPQQAGDDAVEVLLQASSHFSTIGDASMRSFRLLSASLR